jgi:hypothetical protein
MAARGLLAAALVAAAGPSAAEPFHGFNVVSVPNHRFGSESAARSLAALKRTGATAIAVVPFFWQRGPRDPDLARGDDMGDGELRAAIRAARAAGLRVMVKPHVWVEGSWAGAIDLQDDDAWRRWFVHYRAALLQVARIAGEEDAESLAIGTELKASSARPEWREIINAVRAVFSGTLTYAAHNLEEAERVPFWSDLDRIGITLYPQLGADGDRDMRRRTMRATADRLEALAARVGKRVVVAEIGLRSAAGAAAMPWQSAEERVAAPALALQAEVLQDWLAALDRPAIVGVLVWRWFTDPAAGGPTDTDFTVQHKPAEPMLACAWAHRC